MILVLSQLFEDTCTIIVESGAKIFETIDGTERQSFSDRMYGLHLEREAQIACHHTSLVVRDGSTV